MRRGGYHGDAPPALVLGCPPGRRLERRVDTALALWQRGAASRVIVSGAGEATFAAARLIDAGLPPDSVLLEPLARTTWENLVFCRALIGPGPVWLVSDGWHLPRAMACARRLGYVPEGVPVSSEPRRVAHLRAVLREGGAWTVAALRRQLY